MEYSYKFRLYPNQQQAMQIQRTFGCVRFVYNYYLSRRIDAWKNRQETLNYYACSADMTFLKKDSNHLWLQEVDSTALQSSLRDLDTAFQNFFHGLKSHRLDILNSRRNPPLVIHSKRSALARTSLLPPVRSAFRSSASLSVVSARMFAVVFFPLQYHRTRLASITSPCAARMSSCRLFRNPESPAV